MSAFVIYATILINGLVSVIEYKGQDFVDQDKCLHYLVKENKHINETLDKHLKQTYNDHINKTLKEHLNKKENGAIVLYIGCSERSKFIQEGMGA